MVVTISMLVATAMTITAMGMMNECDSGDGDSDGRKHVTAIHCGPGPHGAQKKEGMGPQK